MLQDTTADLGCGVGLLGGSVSWITCDEIGRDTRWSSVVAEMLEAATIARAVTYSFRRT